MSMRAIPTLISILTLFLNLVISSAVLAKDQIDEYIHDYMQSKNIPALQIAILTDTKMAIIILTNLQGAFPDRIITDVADLAREVKTKK